MSHKKLNELPTAVEAIEFRREAYGLNQREMALVLGVTAARYSEIIHGKRAIPKTMMARAFEYGVPAAALFQCHPLKGLKHIKELLAADKRRALKASIEKLQEQLKAIKEQQP